MIIWYLLGGVGILLTYVLGGTKKRRTRTARWLKTGRRKIVGWLKGEHSKRKTARSNTPRAAVRARRRQEPMHAVLPIRKRAKDDPRTVRRVVNRVRVAKANKKAVHAGTDRAQPVTHRVVNKITEAVTAPFDREAFWREQKAINKTAADKHLTEVHNQRTGQCGKPTEDGTACQRIVRANGSCGVKHRHNTPLPGYGH